ncbi:MAG: hypothetical protein WDM77_09560 [Steroidobacteraceae bacterium]
MSTSSSTSVRVMAFTVTYTEILQDGKYLQDGPVLAARFVNQGREYLAVRYVGPSGNADYYSPQAAASTRPSCARPWSSRGSAPRSTCTGCIPS